MAALTEAEELELEMEQARARGKQGGADGSQTTIGAGVKEFGRSVGEGATGLLDLPSRIYTGIRNLPGRLSNSAADAAAAYAPGVDLADFQANAPAPVKLEDPNTYFNTTYNAANPPNPNFPTVRRAGNIVGAALPAVVTGGLAGGWGAVPGVVADAAATTGIQFGAGLGARKLAEATGGDPNQAEESASIFSSFIPPAGRNLVETYNRRRLIDPASPARLADADIAGVPPDISLVGSDRAAAIGPLDPSIRARQQAAIDASFKGAADARRGGSASGPISTPDVGAGVSTAADAAFQQANKDANTIYEPLSTAAGRDTPIDHTIIQAKIDELRGLGVTAKPTLDYYQNLLDTDVANGGLTWDRALRQRRLTEPSETSLKLDPRVQKQINGAFDDALRKRAGEVGYTPQEFDAINAQYGGLQGEKDILGDIRSAKAAPAYNEVFAPSNTGGENLSLIAQHQPPQSTALARILADNLELRARGPSAAGRPELPQDVGLNSKAADWWAALPEKTRTAYSANPAVRDQIDATMNILRADARRSGQLAPTSVDPTTALSIGGAIATGNPGVLAGLTPKVGAWLNRRNLQKEDYLRTIVGGGSTATPARDLARLLSGAVQTGR